MSFLGQSPQFDNRGDNILVNAGRDVMDMVGGIGNLATMAPMVMSGQVPPQMIAQSLIEGMKEQYGQHEGASLRGLGESFIAHPTNLLDILPLFPMLKVLSKGKHLGKLNVTSKLDDLKHFKGAKVASKAGKSDDLKYFNDPDNIKHFMDDYESYLEGKPFKHDTEVWLDDVGYTFKEGGNIPVEKAPVAYELFKHKMNGGMPAVRQVFNQFEADDLSRMSGGVEELAAIEDFLKQWM